VSFPVQAFDAVARARPDAVALILDDSSEVTYGALSGHASFVARALLERGVEQASVACAHGRSLLGVASQIAAWRLGCTFVPLDGSYPIRRQELLLEASRPTILVAEEHLRVPDIVPALRLPPRPPTAPPLDDGARGFGERDALQLLTSGSTGQPKLVGWRPDALARALGRVVGLAPRDADEVWASKASPSFVDNVTEVWGALAAGGRVLLMSPEQLGDPSRFWPAIARARVTRLVLTPSYLKVLLKAPARLLAHAAGVRTWILTGERLEWSLVDALRAVAGPTARIVNQYGSTECWDVASLDLAEVAPAERADAAVPIGRPGAGCALATSDDGELLVISEDVSTGYRGDPEGTAAKLTRVDGGWRYRTGDLARRLADGTWLVTSRRDRQVKINGIRLSLDEVEHAVRSHPAVDDVVVLLRDDDGAPHLEAYVEAAQPPSSGELKAYLKDRLLPAMIPARFEHRERLPRSPNGKLDRPALRSRRAASPTAVWMSLAEAELGRLVHALTGRPIGRLDSLAEHGVDSLRAIELAIAATDALGVEFRGTDILGQDTIAAICAGVDRRTGVSGAGAPPRTGSEHPVSSFLASHLAREWTRGHNDVCFNLMTEIVVRGAVDLDRLRAAAAAVVHRHEALRTTFARRGDGFVQRVQADAPIAFDVRDGARVSHDELVDELRRHRFRWEVPARVRFEWVVTGDDVASLYVCLDHVVGDDRSLWLILRDLFALYDDPAATLPPIVQQRDHAARQRSQARSPEAVRRAERLERICASPAGQAEIRRTATSSPARRRSCVIPAPLLRELERAAAAAGTTVHGLLVGANLGVRHLLEPRPAVLGTAVLSGRDTATLTSSVGVFLNFPILYVDDVPARPLDLARAAASQLREAWAYQDADEYGYLVERGAVQLMLAWRLNYFHRGTIPAAGLALEERMIWSDLTGYQWSMYAMVSDGVLHLDLVGARDAWSAEAFDDAFRLFVAVLANQIRRPDATWADVGVDAPAIADFMALAVDAR
jgi:non-ribosomal peptide synthetase component F